MATEESTPPPGTASGSAAAEADPPNNNAVQLESRGRAPAQTDQSEKLRLTAEKLKLQVH